MGPNIACLRELGQSIVVGGVAYWLLRRSAFAVRVDTPEPTDQPAPGLALAQSLGVDPDGKLIFIDAALCKDLDDAALGAAVRSHHLAVATSGDDGYSGEWEPRRRGIRLKQLKVRYEGFGEDKVPPFGEKINLRWFCKKSGNLLFTLGEGT
uniref:Uncharacterized protein n=1 Tax=Setaria italica TaxID=4555 RepID=A0A0Q3NI10_SETIT